MHKLSFPTGTARWQVGTTLEFYDRFKHKKMTVHPDVILMAVLCVDEPPPSLKRSLRERNVPVGKKRKIDETDTSNNTWFGRAMR